jgi:hypothetical protein
LAVSALTAVVAAGAFGGVSAAPLGNPAVLAGAVEETGMIDSVHCRPGWRHHYPRDWRRADGCRRDGGVVFVPGRTRFIWRDGVRVRVGGDRDRDFRSRTTIRSRDTTTTRFGRDRDVRGDRDVDTRSRSTIRSGSEGSTQSGTTIRSGRDSGGTTSGGNTGARQGGGGGSATQQSPSGGGGASGGGGSRSGGSGGSSGGAGGGGAGGGGSSEGRQ